MSKKFLTLFLLFFAHLNAFSLYIVGEFNGWDGETVIKLSDGSFWIQAEYYYLYCYSYNPNVELINDYGRIKILVKGCGSKAVAVEPLNYVIESKIDGEFRGFDGNTVFRLKNGTVWKQKKYKYWYKYAYNPDCLVYYHYGWKLSVLGKTIDVEKISEPSLSFQNNYNVNNQDVSTFVMVQNKTDKLIFFCYCAYYGFFGWLSRGWFKVEPYSSNMVDIGYYTGNVYLYAEYNGGELWWGDPNSKYSFCVNKFDAFDIPHSDIYDCSDERYKRVKMSEVSVMPGINIWILE